MHGRMTLREFFHAVASGLVRPPKLDNATERSPIWHSPHRQPGFALAIRLGRKAGTTILELLVVFAVITGLVAILLPAIGQVREASRRLQCTNQLRQIGLALHGYHDLYRCLPAGYQWERTYQSAYGWSIPLFPYLELEPFSRQVDRNRAIHDPINDAARRSSLANLLCPSDIREPYFVLEFEDESQGSFVPLVDLPTSNYCGVFGTTQPELQVGDNLGDGTFGGSRPLGFEELRRGLSNTIVIGERTMARLPATWLGVDAQGDDAACRLVGMADVTPESADCDECGFDSRHPGGGNFLFADGHCRLISWTVSAQEYQQMARVSD